jgi:hypothetical protein
MTWSTLRTALGRIARLLRTITAPVQPWDWDELPVRHWWEVYAK